MRSRLCRKDIFVYVNKKNLDTMIRYIINDVYLENNKISVTALDVATAVSYLTILNTFTF